MPGSAVKQAQSAQYPIQAQETRLGLLDLLLLLLILRFGDRRHPLLRPHRNRLIPLGHNRRQISANDPPLVLHCPSRPLLRNLLRDPLLVHPSVHLRPRNLPWVLALQEQ